MALFLTGEIDIIKTIIIKMIYFFADIIYPFIFIF